MENTYVAYYSANNDIEEFESFDLAKAWLADLYQEDGSDGGFSEETMNGRDFIAEKTHTSKYLETQNREKEGYKWCEESQEYHLNGDQEDEMWIYEHDSVGQIEMIPVKNTRSTSEVRKVLEELEELLKTSDYNYIQKTAIDDIVQRITKGGSCEN